MKQTIEEAAIAAIHKHYNCNDCITTFACNECGADEFKEGFIAGVEWEAKQSPWISVQDELPANMQRVLVRSEYEGESLFEVAFMMNGKWMCHNPTPTHWRHIPPFYK